MLWIGTCCHIALHLFETGESSVVFSPTSNCQDFSGEILAKLNGGVQVSLGGTRYRWSRRFSQIFVVLKPMVTENPSFCLEIPKVGEATQLLLLYLLYPSDDHGTMDGYPKLVGADWNMAGLWLYITYIYIYWYFILIYIYIYWYIYILGIIIFSSWLSIYLDHDFPFSNVIGPQLTFTPSFFRGVGLNHQAE